MSVKKYTTLFLDRDGVINNKIDGYVQSFDKFNFIDGVLVSIKNLSDYFDRIIIVTNQQGIGKGIMSIEELDLLHQKMMREIKLNGGDIDQIYYCPHLESINCACRKPKSGMLIKAQSDFPEISFDNSILIGDSDTDILAAENIGVKAIKVSPSYTLSNWENSFLSD